MYDYLLVFILFLWLQEKLYTPCARSLPHLWLNGSPSVRFSLFYNIIAMHSYLSKKMFIECPLVLGIRDTQWNNICSFNNTFYDLRKVPGRIFTDAGWNIHQRILKKVNTWCSFPAKDRHLILVFCGKLYCRCVGRYVCQWFSIKITTNSNTREECLRKSRTRCF